MQMKLIRLKLENFKGIDALEITFDGADAKISGQNGTGKTTIADAYAWVVFGKSFSGEMLEPEIKRRDPETGLCQNDGGVIHAAEVEMVLDGGEALKLRKEYAEQWQKKRGAAESEFRGHTTTYIINDVPITKKAYEKKLSEIIPEDVGRLLSMPLHFCTNLKWQERRKILMELVGDGLDAGFLSEKEHAEFAPLFEAMGSKKPDEYRAMLKAQMKKINDEIKTIPARIDEITSFDFSATDGKSQLVLETEVTSLQTQMKRARDKMAKLENGGANFERNQKLMEIEAAQWKIINGMEKEHKRQKDEAESVMRGCDAELNRIQGERLLKAEKIVQLTNCITTAEKQAENFRNEWIEENAREPEIEISDTCPTCGQPLPPEQIEKAREKAIAGFNAKKAERLKEIGEKGKRIMQQKEEDEKAVHDLEEAVTAADNRIAELEKEREKAEALIANEEKPDFKQDAEWQKLDAQRAALESEKDATNTDDAEIQKLKEEISVLETDIAARNEKLAAFVQMESVKKRKEELLKREKELGAEYSEMERNLDLIERMIRRKVELTEDAINKHFRYVRFTMFRMQVNGGLDECCDATIDGVPVGAGLNTGGEMKAALDILNVLSDHYGLRLPVIIDNAERYTAGSIISIDNQVIRLEVQEETPNLVINVKGKETQEIKAA